MLSRPMIYQTKEKTPGSTRTHIYTLLTPDNVDITISELLFSNCRANNVPLSAATHAFLQWAYRRPSMPEKQRYQLTMGTVLHNTEFYILERELRGEEEKRRRKRRREERTKDIRDGRRRCYLLRNKDYKSSSQHARGIVLLERGAIHAMTCMFSPST